MTAKDIKGLKRTDWLFDWKNENKSKNKLIYKLVIIDNPDIIQGLISVQDKGDHIYMHLIESSKFNRGSRKMYSGVPGNLIAFVCKLSFEKGYDGFISFESKTKLIVHYQQTLGAQVLFGNIMALDSKEGPNLFTKNFFLIFSF